MGCRVTPFDKLRANPTYFANATLPSTSLRYAQDERGENNPVTLSVGLSRRGTNEGKNKDTGSYNCLDPRLRTSGTSVEDDGVGQKKEKTLDP